MQTIPFLARADSETPGAEAPLNVAIFYTDFAAGSQALRLFTRLADCLHTDFLLQLTVWRMTTPGADGVAQNAATAAALADVILLGLHAGTPLPFGIRRWMREVALRRAGRPGVLVKLLVSDDVPGSAPACRDQTAHFSWVDFPGSNGQPPVRASGCGGAERRAKLVHGLSRAFADPRG